MRKGFPLLTALVLTLGLAGHAAARSSGFEAALERCGAVTTPAVLSGCGTDPLTSGRVSVSRHGDLDVRVEGATASVEYEVLLRGLDGAGEMALGVLGTDATGGGTLQRRYLFDLDQAGAVAVVLRRMSAVQFVAGFDAAGELEAVLVACARINTPAAVAGCGTDLLRSGAVEIEQRDVKVDVVAEPDQSYDVVLRAADGPTELALGVLATDRKGRGMLRLDDVIADGAVGAGNVLVSRNGSLQFVTGFVSARRRMVEAVRFEVGLVRCVEVNQLAPLTDCGSDLFAKGFVIIDGKGDVSVHLMGAIPAVQYEAFYVSFDGATEVSIGALTTNPAGNGQMHVRDFFAVGDRGSGNVVIKRGGVDQFVTGFRVVR
jgi:hypothetical protein